MRLSRFMLLAASLTLLISLIGFYNPAEAFWPLDRWFSSDEQAELGKTPPAANAIQAECEPIRQKIIELNRSHRLMHPFVRPRVGLLKRDYRQCLDRINQQEYEYLKQAEIQLPHESVQDAPQTTSPQAEPEQQEPKQPASMDLPPLAPALEN